MPSLQYGTRTTFELPSCIDTSAILRSGFLPGFIMAWWVGIVWAEFVTTSIIVVTTSKEVMASKAWGLLCSKGPREEQCG